MMRGVDACRMVRTIGLVTALLPAATALGQPTTLSQYRQVAKSCKAEVEQYCPDLAGQALAARNQAICLKPFKASLGLSCRRAVRALYP